ncbi:MAG: hypothetical protein P8Q14_10925 [Vicingaceae bacterium]|nr:hypothetical protein [Vicingaceae bacterium]
MEERTLIKLEELGLTGIREVLEKKYSTKEVVVGVSSSVLSIGGDKYYEEVLTVILPHSSMDSIGRYNVFQLIFSKMDVKSLKGHKVEVLCKGNRSDFDFNPQYELSVKIEQKLSEAVSTFESKNKPFLLTVFKYDTAIIQVVNINEIGEVKK